VIPQATSSLDKTSQEPTSAEETTSKYENMLLHNSSNKITEKVATNYNTGSIQNWISDNIDNSTQENANTITNTIKDAFNNEQHPMAHRPANANVSEPSDSPQAVNEYDKGDRNYKAFVSLEQDQMEQRSEKSQPKSVEQDQVEQRSEGSQSKRLETVEKVIAEKGSSSALSFSDALTKVMDVKDKLIFLKLEKALQENKEKLNTQTVPWIRKNTLKAHLKILKRIEKISQSLL